MDPRDHRAQRRAHHAGDTTRLDDDAAQLLEDRRTAVRLEESIPMPPRLRDQAGIPNLGSRPPQAGVGAGSAFAASYTPVRRFFRITSASRITFHMSFSGLIFERLSSVHSTPTSAMV